MFVEQWKTEKQNLKLFVYYESIKRDLKIRSIYECRCDERLQTKTKEFTFLTYTGSVVEMEHLKIGLVVYYESIKRNLQIRGMYECRCDERLQSKTIRTKRNSWIVMAGGFQRKYMKAPPRFIFSPFFLSAFRHCQEQEETSGWSTQRRINCGTARHYVAALRLVAFTPMHLSPCLAW